MVSRKSWKAAALAALLALGAGASADAQFMYPGGYGAFGWGGWGGGETAYGSIARGMGVYAAGAGIYNLNTAQANSINVDTITRWNQYLYESQVNANRSQRLRMERRQAQTVRSVEDLEKRLREAPTERDILSGSALNMAVEQISDPRVYAKALTTAKTKIGGELVRNIPFQYAAQAITTSVHQIIDQGAPPLLRTPAFEPERGELREMVNKLRAEMEEGETIDPTNLKNIQDRLLAVRAKFDKTVQRNSPGWAQADRFLKAAYGLTRMLETPAVDVLLSGVEKRPDVTLTELLGFMNAFNFRFGPATTPEQRMAYQTLWPIVDRVRDEAVATLAPSATASTSSADAAADFFSGMEHSDLTKKPGPAPAPAPPQPK
ncbi:MAG: hypothetical protein K2X91_08595, partial [Thermoleophilia bacterium]|nr:hypothetical protein [Thermoleophilia bacterium]